MAVAKGFGATPAAGLFMGSIAYLGGHGTATAWASAPQAQGIVGAFEIGIGSATLGLVLGGLVAGPVSVWLATHNATQARHATVFEGVTPAVVAREPAFSSDRWISCLLLILACLALGPWLREAAVKLGFKAPTVPRRAADRRAHHQRRRCRGASARHRGH